jgi:asparagine synthase (glutamine-hydrolysing)
VGGFLGAWNLDGRPVASEPFEEGLRRLAHRGPDGRSVWREGSAAIGALLSRVTPESHEEVQPVVGSSGAVAVFDGRLDNRADLVAELGRRGRLMKPSPPDVQIVLALYEALDDRFIDLLAGDFALAIYDPERGVVLLGRDALGVRPIYYYRGRGFTVFASEIKAILADPRVEPRPNDDLIAQWLLTGWSHDQPGATFFRDVFSVPPSHIVSIARDSASKRRYWDFDTDAEIRLRDFREYAEAFRERFEAAVTRRMRSAHPIAISLSGGLDSSSIASFAALARDRNGGTPEVLAVSSFGPEGSASDERVFARSVADRWSMELVQREIVPGGLVGHGSDIAWAVEGPLGTPVPNMVVDLLAASREHGARLMLTGHWGDQFVSDQTYYVDLARCFRWVTLARRMLERRRWALDEDPMVDARAFVRSLAISFLPAEMRPFLRRFRTTASRPVRDAPWFSDALRGRIQRSTAEQAPPRGRFRSHHARAVYEQARSPYAALSMEWQNKSAAAGGLEIAFPYLDRDLIGYLMAIPGDVPEHAGIARAILREATVGLLPEDVRRRRWKGSMTDVGNRSIAVDLEAISSLLRQPGGALDAGYLDAGGLARLPSPSEIKDRRAATHLDDVAALDMWVRAFLSPRD